MTGLLRYRCFLPFGFRAFAHRSTSDRIQTGVARRRVIGSGKSGSLVSRIACRRVTRNTSATSARPTRLSFRFSAIASKMVSYSKVPPRRWSVRGPAPGQVRLVPVQAAGYAAWAPE